MDSTVLAGIMIPFLGTLLGSACVYFMKGEMKESTQKMLAGFTSGVMVAASVWSLLIPSLDQSQHMGTFAFVPASVGFLFGILFLLAFYCFPISNYIFFMITYLMIIANITQKYQGLSVIIIIISQVYILLLNAFLNQSQFPQSLVLCSLH